jgi:hypothetical protein
MKQTQEYTSAEEQIRNVNLGNLIKILRIKRPSNSSGQDKLAEAIKNSAVKNASLVVESNLYMVFQVEDPVDGQYTPRAFVAHMDTMHRKEGENPITVTIDKIFAGKSECLGADDGAGCWILLEMIFAKVPGYYIFTKNEECGGKGAQKLFSNEKGSSWFSEVSWFIEFDRKGQSDVIYEHFTGPCASLTDAKAICDLLSPLGLKPCDKGCYTDIAEFACETVACVNISVGYEAAHTEKEYLDLNYIKKLRNLVISVDWSRLPKPTKYDSFSHISRVKYYHGATHWPSSSLKEIEESVLFPSYLETERFTKRELKLFLRMCEVQFGITKEDFEDFEAKVRQEETDAAYAKFSNVEIEEGLEEFPGYDGGKVPSVYDY